MIISWFPVAFEVPFFFGYKRVITRPLNVLDLDLKTNLEVWDYLGRENASYSNFHKIELNIWSNSRNARKKK